MRRIEFDLHRDFTAAKTIVMPVHVDWFPPRTPDQILANSLAVLDGQPQPHPDPNFIEVVVNLQGSTSGK